MCADLVGIEARQQPQRCTRRQRHVQRHEQAMDVEDG
jgi:hypothetical protein